MSTPDLRPGRAVVPGQAAVGIGLATLIIAAWTGLHVFGVFFYPWSRAGVVLSPLLVAVLCWLNVGLFIVAHDAMHGSLAPIRPRLNRAIGRFDPAPLCGIFVRSTFAEASGASSPAGNRGRSGLLRPFSRPVPPLVHRFHGTLFRVAGICRVERSFLDIPAAAWHLADPPPGLLGVAVGFVSSSAFLFRHLSPAPPRERAVRGPAPRT